MAYSDPGTVTGGVTPARATWANTVRGDLVDHETRILSLESIVKQSIVTPTNAQIKALPTTPITLVAAQGANTLVLPKRTIIVFKPGSAYTNRDANGFWVGGFVGSYAGLTSEYLYNDDSTSPAVANLDSLLTITSGAFHVLDWPWKAERSFYNWGNETFPIGYSAYLNQPAQLLAVNGGLGDYTGGNVSNVWKMITEYDLLDLS